MTSAGGSDVVEAATFLSNTRFFADLTAAQLAALAPLCRVQDYAEGSQVYNLGDRAEDFYVLMDGMVRFTIGYGARQATTGEVIRRGEVFGWAALIEQAQRRIATAYCMTPCRVLSIGGNAMLQAMDRDHSLGYRVMKQLTFLITGELTAFAAG